jgi:hypothetical protein
VNIGEPKDSPVIFFFAPPPYQSSHAEFILPGHDLVVGLVDVPDAHPLIGSELDQNFEGLYSVGALGKNGIVAVA